MRSHADDAFVHLGNMNDYSPTGKGKQKSAEGLFHSLYKQRTPNVPAKQVLPEPGGFNLCRFLFVDLGKIVQNLFDFFIEIFDKFPIIFLNDFRIVFAVGQVGTA